MAMNVGYHSPQDIPETIPVFPLPRALLLPRVDLPLNIFEPRYLQMIDDVLRGDRIIGMIQPNEPVKAPKSIRRFIRSAAPGGSRSSPSLVTAAIRSC
jgi:uncharacterized protein